MNLILKKTSPNDLETLFLFQKDDASNQMAAFTAENPDDKIAYFSKWLKIIQNPSIPMQTIFKDGMIVGSVLHFELFNEVNVSYWVGRPYWKQGIATKALQLFLQQTVTRPLYGWVAFDNYGSQKVLEKCGFIFVRKEAAFAPARKQTIEEFVYKLEK